MNKLYITTLFFLIIYSNVIGQTKCQKDRQDGFSEIFTVTEIMPTLKTPVDELENKLNNEILLKEYNVNEGQALYITFIVNCKGEDFDYKILRFENELFANKFTECLKNFSDWTPGYQKEGPVDVQVNIKFEIKDNKIRLIYDDQKNKKELKKLEKLHKKK